MRIVHFVMVPRLFEKIEKVFPRNVFQEKKKKGRGLKSAMKSNNIRMQMQRLVDGDLGRK